MVALSCLSIGGNKKVSARIIADNTVNNMKINTNAARQTDRILVEAIFFSLLDVAWSNATIAGNYTGFRHDFVCF